LPKVVNFAKKSPATHRLGLYHDDQVEVLAAVISQLRRTGISVREGENVVFEAAAAVARLPLPRGPHLAAGRPGRYAGGEHRT
jgi:hypothetical protein